MSMTPDVEKEYTVHSNFRHDGASYKKGDTVQLTLEEASIAGEDVVSLVAPPEEQAKPEPTPAAPAPAPAPEPAPAGQGDVDGGESGPSDEAPADTNETPQNVTPADGGADAQDNL